MMLKTLQVKRLRRSGFTTLEVLVALLLIVLVVMFTGRVVVTTLALIGRGTTGENQGARMRSEATAWIQAVTEHTQKLGFGTLKTACASVPCEFSIPTAPGPYAGAPPLPASFQCARVLLRDWDSIGGTDSNDLRLVTVEVYRASCADAAPFLVAHTGVGRRQ